MAGIYECVDHDIDLASVNTYLPAVKACVDAHPMLSAVIGAENSNNPIFARPAKLDLSRHLRVKTFDGNMTDEEEILKSELPKLHDEQFEHCEVTPPWRIVAIPLPVRGIERKCFIAFAYSHSHGDGISGLVVHRTFLDTLRSHANWDGQTLVSTPKSPLPPPLDDILSVSWGYLLGPLIGSYLPTTVSKMIGFPTHIAPATDSAWTGSPMFYEPEKYSTGIELIQLENQTVEHALNECRRHQAKMTALLHEVIIHAVRTSLPSIGEKGDLVSITLINLRKHLTGVSSDVVGGYISAVHGIDREEDSSASTHSIELDYARMWSEAQALTTHFAESAATTKDQPSGLMKYVRDIRAWTMGQIGKQRDASYELSNIMSFDPAPKASDENSGKDIKWKLEKMIFSQPANAFGTPLNFSVVSVKGGNMVISLTWQIGALGVANESAFAKSVCKVIKSDFERLMPSS